MGGEDNGVMNDEGGTARGPLAEILGGLITNKAVKLVDKRGEELCIALNIAVRRKRWGGRRRRRRRRRRRGWGIGKDGCGGRDSDGGRGRQRDDGRRWWVVLM